MGVYINWEEVFDIQILAKGKWATPDAIIKFIDELLTANIAVKSVRETVIAKTSSLFELNLELNEKSRFPASGHYISKLDDEVVDMITRIVTAICKLDATKLPLESNNYNNSNQPNDFYDTLKEFLNLIKRPDISLSQEQFEIRFGLVWDENKH